MQKKTFMINTSIYKKNTNNIKNVFRKDDDDDCNNDIVDDDTLNGNVIDYVNLIREDSAFLETALDNT